MCEGSAAVHLVLDHDGQLKGTTAAGLVSLLAYGPDSWYHLAIALDARTHGYDLSLNGVPVSRHLVFDASVEAVERIVFRTGPARREPAPDTDRDGPGDLPGADEPGPPAVYDINQVTVRCQRCP